MNSKILSRHVSGFLVAKQSAPNNNKNNNNSNNCSATSTSENCGKIKTNKTKSHTRGHKANASQDSQVPQIDRQGKEACVLERERACKLRINLSVKASKQRRSGFDLMFRFAAG